MAGAEDAAHAGGGPCQFTDVGTAAGAVCGLGGMEARHVEQPVGEDQSVQLVRARGRKTVEVTAYAVPDCAEDLQATDAAAVIIPSRQLLAQSPRLG
ncbi:hypothetical protein [Streptomyces sp. ISL-94]|uniref:hypothetical protein n=1 Tax=Streptomyces sp. ISL-94 TaxID=2819190 RepID=UPI001BE70344|nr:hypothetical protein [Streptomyces sp. ISL-94]MBT2482413.1 hypothetical protein [Streptomyces sp. ISL-94]